MFAGRNPSTRKTRWWSATRVVAPLAAVAAVAAGIAVTPSDATAATTGYKVPSLSGNTWASGVFTRGTDPVRDEAFATYRGRPLDVVTTWPARTTWDDFIQPVEAYTAFSGKPYTMAYGIPPVPEGDANATMAGCAAGSYNSKWVTFANTMLSTNQGSSIIRLGWEMNGNWYKWGGEANAANARAHATQFAACFRQIVTTVRAVAPNLKFDWNVNRGFSEGIRATADVLAAYPGDDVVDIVGIDSYDSWLSWNDQLNSEQALNYWLNFAIAHDKKLSVPEWGVFTSANGKGGHDDNPTYIQAMYDFFTANAANIAYESYFSNETDDGANSLWNPVQMPLSSAKYKQLWTSTVTPPTATPTPTPTPGTGTTTKIEDTATGTTTGTVQFSTGWSACTGTTCTRASDNSYQWTATTGSTATVRFTGNTFTWYGMKEPFSVIATVAVDGGTPVDVDPYVATASTGTVPIYTSPTLTQGTHTAVITMTNRRNTNSTGGASITFDRFDVTSAG
jgi:hypothetical protein